MGGKIVCLAVAVAGAAGCVHAQVSAGIPGRLPVPDAGAGRVAPAGVAEPQAAATQASGPAPAPAGAPPTGGPEPARSAAPPAGAPEAAPAPPAGAPEAPANDAADGSEPGRDPHFMRRVVGWISLSIGAEAAIVAVATSLLIEHQKSLRDDGCNAQKTCTPEGLGAVSTISTIIPWNTASWFVAAAGVGVGTVLVVISQPEREKQTAITLSPGGLGLGVRSTF
jgi:hypothetical protein